MVSSPRSYVKTRARAVGFFLGRFLETPALFGSVRFLSLIQSAPSHHTRQRDMTQRGEIRQILRLGGRRRDGGIHAR